MGWQVLHQDETLFSVIDQNGISLWFDPVIKDHRNDYDGVGVNHLAFTVPTQGDVDAMVSWLEDQQLATLFGTPCHRLDFADTELDTYYQVIFESPDRILLEVVYTGPLTT